MGSKRRREDLTTAALVVFVLVALANLTAVTAETHGPGVLRRPSDRPFGLDRAEQFFSTSGHSNNWAVIVCTSRFYYNYRHVANALSFYHTVKRLGIPDSQILLMLADDMACDSRNVQPGTVYNSPSRDRLNLYGTNVEVDYRGYQVSVEAFLRALTGRHKPETPRSQRLNTDDRSNVMIYMTGHGGDEFLKFQDDEEINSHDLGSAFGQMWQQGRYHELLFIIDTCQAATIHNHFYSPNVVSIGSSRLGENSYSMFTDTDLGVALIDRFTYYTLEAMERVDSHSQSTVLELFQSYKPTELMSQVEWRDDLFRKGLNNALLTDFFGAVLEVEITTEGYPLTGVERSSLSGLDSPPRTQWFSSDHTLATLANNSDERDDAEFSFDALWTRLSAEFGWGDVAERTSMRLTIDVAGASVVLVGLVLVLDRFALA